MVLCDTSFTFLENVSVIEQEDTAWFCKHESKKKTQRSVALRPSGAELFISDTKTSVSRFVNKSESNLFYVP